MSKDEMKAQARRCQSDLLKAYDDKLHCTPEGAEKVARLKVGLGIMLGVTKGIAAGNGKASDYGRSGPMPK